MARACAYVGSLAAGAYFGYALSWIRVDSDLVVERIVRSTVAGVCGAVGQAISGFSRGGCLVSIALGFIGALIGTWLANAIGLNYEPLPVHVYGQTFPVVWSIIGSAVFVAVIGLISRGRA